MQSKISLCNRAVFRKNLTRFWPIWALYLVIWLLALPMSIYTNFTRDLMPADLQSYVYSVGLQAGTVLNFFYGIVVAMCLFSPFYGSRSVNTVAALPVRRESMFLTHVCTGFAVALVPNLVVMLLTMAAGASIGVPCVLLCLEWFAIQALLFAFFFGLAVLCACLVGSLWFLPVLYGLVNFAAVVLNFIVLRILATFVYGMPSNYRDLVMMPLSPMVELLSRSARLFHEISETEYFYTFARWRYVGVLGAGGIALMAVAFCLFRKRHMESAGDVIAIRPLRPVFKYCFTAGACVVVGSITASLAYPDFRQTGVAGLCLCLLFGAFVGYFTAEMLLKKTFRVWTRAWIGFGAFAVCLIGLVCAMEFDVTGYERRVPQLAEVQSVSLQPYYSGRTVELTDSAYVQDVITLHQRTVTEKRNVEAQLDYDNHYVDFELRYTLTDGSVLQRYYSLPYDPYGGDLRDRESLISQFVTLYNDPYVEAQRYSPRSGLTVQDITNGYIDVYRDEGSNWENQALTAQQAHTLYAECILPDIREGKLKTPQLFDPTNQSAQLAERDSFSIAIMIDFARYAPGSDGKLVNVNDTISLDLNPSFNEAPRTIAFLEELGITFE